MIQEFPNGSGMERGRVIIVKYAQTLSLTIASSPGGKGLPGRRATSQLQPPLVLLFSSKEGKRRNTNADILMKVTALRHRLIKRLRFSSGSVG